MPLECRTIGTCFAHKREVFSVPPDTSVLTALEILAEKDVGALLVMQGDRMVGIMSERDYARKGERMGKAARDTAVREIMTEQVIYVTPNDTVDTCVAIMRQKRLRHLPVMDNGKVVWVMSSRDILEQLIVEEERHIRDLERDRMYVMNAGSNSY